MSTTKYPGVYANKGNDEGKGSVGVFFASEKEYFYLTSHSPSGPFKKFQFGFSWVPDLVNYKPVSHVSLVEW